MQALKIVNNYMLKCKMKLEKNGQLVLVLRLFNNCSNGDLINLLFYTTIGRKCHASTSKSPLGWDFLCVQVI